MRGKPTGSELKARKNRRLVIIATALAAVVLAAAVYLLVFSGTYTPQTDELIYERDIATDGGVRLDPATVVSLGTVRTNLRSLCSQEQRDRWGADAQGADGVGLRAVFVRKSGTREVSRETVTIPSWQTSDETPLPTRRALVAERCNALSALSTAFVAPVTRNCVMALVVDTTNGMDAVLNRRARETITESRDRLSGETCGAGGFYLYRLTATPSQGDRWRVLRGRGFEEGMRGAETWLLASQPEQGESSVLRGLAASLTEIARLQPADVVRVDIFTDGLENVGDRSVYRDASLLDEENWPVLDGAWDPASLRLAGLDVHLRPLPNQSEKSSALSQRAFLYLKARLEQAGARVTTEPL